MAASYETELVLGIACALHDAGLGWFDARAGQDQPKVPKPGEVDLPVILLGHMPDEPDEVITINYYDREQIPGTGVYWSLVQIRSRIDSRKLTAVLDRLGAIRDLFDEKGYVRLGRVVASQSKERSFANLGLDNHTPARRDVTQNYGFKGLRYLHPLAA
jgi:hypothetical protein